MPSLAVVSTYAAQGAVADTPYAVAHAKNPGGSTDNPQYIGSQWFSGGLFFIRRGVYRYPALGLSGNAKFVSGFIRFDCTTKELLNGGVDWTLTMVDGTGCFGGDGDYFTLLSATTAWGTIDTSLIANGSPFDLPFNATGLAGIPKNAVFWLGFRHSDDINNISVGAKVERLRVNAGAGTSTLNLTYTVSSGGGLAARLLSEKAL